MEVYEGTDPTLEDTDGDGLTDGEEVDEYETDPLETDTDGGGVDDGDEVAAGTDPLDPSDDLPPADDDDDDDVSDDDDDDDTEPPGCSCSVEGSTPPLSGLLALLLAGLVVRRRA